MKELTTDLVFKNMKASKPSRGFLTQAFSLLCRLWLHNNNDYEKKLESLSKEEAMIHTRLQRRSQTWKKFSRRLVLYSIVGEVLLLGIALVITRSPGLSWQTCAIRVFPVFALPTITILIYSTCASYCRLCEQKDGKTLKRLHAERQAKINDLKESTKYYTVQQLIHKYDPDPTEKAAAASVLASRSGIDVGSIALISPKASKNATFLSHGKNENQDVSVSIHHSSSINENKAFTPQRKTNGRLDVECREDESFIKDSYEPQSRMQHHSKREIGGLATRIATTLAEEDPSLSYALICKTCHAHNGLACKENFQHITYFCRHCHTLNCGQPQGEWTVELGVQAQLSPQSSNIEPEVNLLPTQNSRKDVTLSNLAGTIHLNTVPKVTEIKKIA